MANIKSQKKRALTNLKRQNARTGQKSQLKTAIKKVLEAVPALKGTTEQGGDGFRKIGGDGTNGDGQASNDALRRAFGLKPKP